MAYKTLTFEQDQAKVRAFMQKNVAYWLYQDGLPISEQVVHDFFYGELPPNKSYRDKMILGFEEENQLVAVVDLLEDYPKAGTWVVGLFVVDAAIRSQGKGTQLWELLKEFLLENNVQKARLGVLEDNERGKYFWKKVGFTATGASAQHADGRLIIVMEQPLSQ